MPIRTPPAPPHRFGRTFRLLPLFLLLVPACGDPAAERAERVERLRSQAEALTRRQMLMGFESWAFGAPSDQDSLYRAYPDLFTPAAIADVRAAGGSEPDSVQARRLLWFRRYLVAEYLARETAPLADRTANVEAAATVDGGAGARVPYRQAAGTMANEERADARARLYEAMNPVLDTLNALLREALDRKRALSAALGYASYTALAEDLRGFPVDETAAMAESVLAATDGLYDTLLVQQLRSLPGVGRPSFRRSDTGRLMRAAAFDGLFPAAALLPTVRELCRGLGIGLDSLPNLTFDVEARERKNPRAVCFPVDVPEDVRLSIKPSGGVGDLSALLHELGHGLHFALTRERSFEFRTLGDATVTETYAFLLQNILANPAFLRQRFPMPPEELRRFVRFMAFSRTSMIRRYAAKVIFEQALHAGAPSADSLYAALLARAGGFTPVDADRKRYLADTDDLFYSAVYLRAWFLEAQLADHLARTYGANWFENPAAGIFLAELWRSGARPTASELAARAGGGPVLPDALLRQLRVMVLFAGS